MYFLEFGISGWLISLAILTVFLAIAWRQKRSIWHLLFLSGFWLYLVLLISVALFPIPIGTDYQPPAGTQAWQYILAQVNLIPFKYVIRNDASPLAIFYEISNNVVMTIPFGFGLNFLAHIKPRNFIWIAILAGLSIEAAQLGISLLLIGHPFFHTVDITDFILNTLGALLGYGCFHLFTWLHRRGLGAYVDEIVRR